MKTNKPLFSTISQRVAVTHIRAMRPFEPCLPGEADAPARERLEQSLSALHQFLMTLYQQVFDHPEAFGLPLTPDDALIPGEPNEKERKQTIARSMKKTRDGLTQALDFLMRAGAAGTLEGAALRIPLDDTLAAVKRSRNQVKFLQGIQLAGLQIHEEEQSWLLENTQFPAMMPALQALAAACAAHPDARMGSLNFARCDFQAITQADYIPPVLEMYRAFDEAEFQQLAALHGFFTARGYHASLHSGGKYDWLVQYQGSKKAKSTPLFQVEYQERYRDPLQLQIKCASTARIAPLLPLQSAALQADFIQRAYPCRGDECGWCRNNKSLGPSRVQYQGETLTLCWYSNPTIPELNAESVQLIEEYALMHEALAG